MQCPTCKHLVADNARACPQCGHRFHTLLAKVFFWLVVVPMIIAIIAGLIFSK